MSVVRKMLYTIDTYLVKIYQTVYLKIDELGQEA
jgi:hypothetical protein